MTSPNTKLFDYALFSMYILFVSCSIWGTNKNTKVFFYEINKDILFSQDRTGMTYTINIVDGNKTLFTYLNNSTAISFAIELDTTFFVITPSDTNDIPIFVSYSRSGPSWSCKIVSGEISGTLNSDSSWHVTGSELKADSICDNKTYFFEEDFTERN